MPHPSHAPARIAVALSACLSLPLAACSSVEAPKHVGPPDPTTSPAATKLTSEDFKPVCQGATQSRATTYIPDAPSHKAILFTPLGHSLVEDTGTLPADWTVQFDANRDNYAAIDLVTCTEIKDEHSVKDCTGYQDNGHATENKVDLRFATYTVTVRIAVSGKEIGRTELSGTDDTCPLFMSFDSDTQTKPYDVPPPKEDLTAFVKQFVQP